MNQTEIEAAVAAQEEHIRRQQSCGGVIGQQHAFRPSGLPARGRRPARKWSACVVCGVTETIEDYKIKTA